MFVVSPYSDKILYKEKGSLSPLGTIVSAEELVVVVNGFLTHSLQPSVVCPALEVLVAVVEWCMDIFRCRSSKLLLLQHWQLVLDLDFLQLAPEHLSLHRI